MRERLRHPEEIGLRLAAIVAVALVAELCTAYSYATFRTASGFFYVTFAANTALPVACATGLLGLSLRDLGLGVPRLQRRDLFVFTGLLVIATLVALPLLGQDSYQAAYAERRAASADSSESAVQFVWFLVSALAPSELMHRAFLLFGIRAVLARVESTRRLTPTLAILITLSFEVLSHLPKPPTEAIALLFASPVLSWAAFRTESVWLPLAAHLYIEALFFALVLA